MPYFYLQDGEYLALKAAVVNHIREKASGLPQGVASIETAIEALKVCDLITEALMAPKEAFCFQLANHPSSWGVDYADSPTNPPWDGVLRCIAESGFAGTELGPVGYYDPDRLGGLLKQHKLQLTAGNIFEKRHDPAEMPAILEKTHKSCRILKEHGARFFTIVPHIAEERVSTAGRPADAQKLPDDRWKQFMQAIIQV